MIYATQRDRPLSDSRRRVQRKSRSLRARSPRLGLFVRQPATSATRAYLTCLGLFVRQPATSACNSSRARCGPVRPLRARSPAWTDLSDSRRRVPATQVALRSGRLDRARLSDSRRRVQLESRSLRARSPRLGLFVRRPATSATRVALVAGPFARLDGFVRQRDE